MEYHIVVLISLGSCGRGFFLRSCITVRCSGTCNSCNKHIRHLFFFLWCYPPHRSLYLGCDTAATTASFAVWQLKIQQVSCFGVLEKCRNQLHWRKLTVTKEMYCKVIFFPKTSNQIQNQSKNDLKSKSQINRFKIKITDQYFQVILNQNQKITIVIWNHDFKSNDFKSFPTLYLYFAYQCFFDELLFVIKPVGYSQNIEKLRLTIYLLTYLNAGTHYPFERVVCTVL